VTSLWLNQLVPFVVFAFANAGIQKVALRSTTAALWYVAVAAGALVLLRLRRRLAIRQLELQFDASPADAMATLSLSEALS
jgi:hypothetical protein